MRKVVLLPSKTKHKIFKYLNRTFEDENYIVFKLCDFIITNYATKETSIVADRILKRLNLFIEEYELLKEKPKIYILLVGGIYHNIIVVRRLIEANLDFDLLIFERRVGKYVIVDSRKYCVKGLGGNSYKRLNWNTYYQ